jgi:probable rRNA maturation factor
MDWTLAPALRILPATALPDLSRAESVAETLLVETGYADAEVSILLTDDPGIHILNKEWRGYDKPTDVLSWPMEEGVGYEVLGIGQATAPSDTAVPTIQNPTPNTQHPTPILLGDVAISLDTAKRQAEARGWAVEEEIALLLVHGILHLLGHEDETDAGAEGMRIVEQRLLGKPLEKVDA